MPSLEWLERVNSRAIVISALMIGVGFVSGIILNLVLHERRIDQLPWSDPIIWRTALMFGWLLAAVIFSALYRPARGGRKVAYLTVASFAFLAVSLGLGLLLPSEHGGAAAEKQKAEIRRQNEEAQNQRQSSRFPAAYRLPPTAFCLRGVPCMKLQMVGCSHHHSSVEVRERLAFSPDQAASALGKWRESFPTTEAVLLSTCNRVEIYTAADDPALVPSEQQVMQFLAEFHGLQLRSVFDDLFEQSGEGAVRHLFCVAASLDSMVLGEPQILAQVKQAYQLAMQQASIGPITHEVFQRPAGG